MTTPEQESYFAVCRQQWEAALSDAYESTREWWGKTLRPRLELKAEHDFRTHVPMSFSRTLIGLAGGIANLRKYWEIENCVKCGAADHPSWECRAKE